MLRDEEFNDVIKKEILKALENDQVYSFKETSKYFQQGICPECGKRSCFVAKAKPYRIECNHKNNCGFYETTRERYSDIFEDISERFPSTPESPNATASAYMSQIRCFPSNRITGWFTQGALPLKSGRLVPTVRFNLWEGHYWERIINAKDVREHGDKNHISYGTSFKNKGWMPPGQKIDKGDDVFIVEGIFHAIALYLIGKKVIAAFSSNNLPREIIAKYQGKNISWCLGYDNDEGGTGNEATYKYRGELRARGESFLICQCPKGEDWDDIYRKGELTDYFLEECLHRGRVSFAESIEEKTYWLYSKHNFNHKIIDFDNRFFNVSVDNFAEDLSAAIADASEGDEKNNNKSELHNKSFAEALKTDKGQQLFYSCLKVNPISNCLPRFIYAEMEKMTLETIYNFSVYYPGRKRQKPVLMSLPGTGIDSRGSFKRSLIRYSPGATFKGTDNQYELILDQWFGEGVLIVESVPFVGYDKDSGVYVFPKFSFHNGRYLKPNIHGYVNAGETRIKTTLRSIDIKTNKTFSANWFNNFFKVFDYNGICCVAFFLGSLFAEQLRKKIGFFPFLELTGEPGAGKTMLLEFCWKLLGRSDYEGENPSKATFSARGRMFSQVANMPVVLIEGDSRDGKDAKKGAFDFSELKDLFNGRGIRARAVFNNGNDIDAPPFRGTVVIAQNATVDADEAVLSRIVHMHATRKHQRKENKHLAEWFRTADINELNGFLYQALSKEAVIFETIYTEYYRLVKGFTANTKVTMSRIAECHAFEGALVKALAHIFPVSQGLIDNTMEHLQRRAESRQQRVGGDHPTVASFWEIYDLLNVRAVQSEDAAMANLPGIEQETLNHSKDPDLIAINLQEFIRAADLAHMERLDVTELRKLLPGSRKHAFVGNKTVKSQIVSDASRWCAVFKKGPMTG